MRNTRSHRLHRFVVSSAATWLPLCLAGLGTSAAWAQAVAPRDPEAATRAAREADNPMRVILEASKLKVRIKPDGKPDTKPDADDDKRAAARPAPAPRAAAQAAAPASAPVPTPAAPTVAKAGATPAPGPAVKAAEPMKAAAPAPSNAVAAAPATVPEKDKPVPATTVAKAPDTLPSLPPPVIPTVAAAPLPPVALKLAQLVEPQLPDAAMRRLRRDVEVVVNFTVNTDGSVSDVAVRPTPMKSLDAAIAEAVSQWRYEPIREARTHAVQLVLRASAQ